MNPIRLRRILLVTCAPAACAALPACAGVHSTSTRDLGTRATSMQHALRCDRLQDADSAYEVVAPGKGNVKIKFPASHTVAVLRVPRAAVPAPTTFVMKVERGATSRALINITARRGTESVTTFDQPLLLQLHVRSGCKPSKPARDSTFYVYTMQLNPAGDTSLVEGHGDYIDPLILGHKRVEALLEHLSGFILAQGLR